MCGFVGAIDADLVLAKTLGDLTHRGPDAQDEYHENGLYLRHYRLAIIGAEYLLKLLPRGTHDFAKFIRPSELEAWTRSAGLELKELTGMSYNPLTREYRLGTDVSVNYLACFRRS